MCDVCTLFVLWVWYETENTSTITLWWHPLFLLLNPYFFEFISELPIQFSRPDSLIIYIIKIDLARHTYMHMCVWFIYKINLLWKNTWSTAGMLYVCSIQFGRWYITQEVLWPVIRLPSLLTSTTVPSNEQDVQEILVQILLFFSFPFSLCCTSVGLKCAHTVAAAGILQHAMGSSLGPHCKGVRFLRRPGNATSDFSSLAEISGDSAVMYEQKGRT